MPSQHELSPAVAAILRMARKRRGLTLDEVARIAGCGKPMLSLLEHGHRAPSVTMAEGLVRAYRLSDDEAKALRSESVAGVGWDKPSRCKAAA